MMTSQTDSTHHISLADKIESARRIVIKIGSALLFDGKSGEARQHWLDRLGDDIAALSRQGKEVIIVSSGSIALGRQILGLKKTLKLEAKQAAAAAGQVALVQLWADALAAHNLTAAQILLAPDDTETRKRHINARDTISTLLALGVVPVVNENDTITTYEIRFGDNDRLAARVAAMMSADLLILLSDIDGLYSANPKLDRTARHIPYIGEITDEIIAMGGDSDTEFASGGMTTKLAAAQIASKAGVTMGICSGVIDRPLSHLKEGGKASLFAASTSAVTARKNWIAGALAPQGQIHIDKGAYNALQAGKSLLPVGVTRVTGTFDRGDLVQLLSPEGDEIGYGLTAYSNQEAQKLAGQKSADITAVLGYEHRDELVHADDLVIIKASSAIRQTD